MSTPKIPVPRGFNRPPSRQIKDEQRLRFGGDTFEDPPAGALETGVVTDYFATSALYEVTTDTGRIIPYAARLVQTVGDVSVLPRNTIVVVSYALGTPYIIGVRQQPTAGPQTGLSPTVTEVRGVGGEDGVYTADPNDPYSRPEENPQDLLGGDHVWVSPDGNAVGALAGGTSFLRGSPLAQVRAHGLTDMVEIISSLYRHISAIGELTITNTNGKPSLRWRAGTDQSTETGANSENWTLRLDAGAEGNIFNFEVTTPSGATLARINMGPDGRLSFVGVGGVDTTSGADLREAVVGSKDVDVHGALTERVAGDVALSALANRETQVSKNDTLQVGGARATNGAGDDGRYVGGTASEKISAGARTEVVGGGLEVVGANPLSGGKPGAGDFGWINYGGGFAFVAQAQGNGKFTVMSALPGSVMLGCDGAAVANPATGKHTVVPSPAPFAVMKYEPFQAMMTALLTWLDTHTHGFAAGAVTPPPAPASAIVNALLQPIKSVRVLVGL